jgi:hypothetical protein
MPVVEVKSIEPAALSPNGAAAYLSLSKRAIYLLIAGDKIIARRDGARTLVDFESIKATNRCHSRPSPLRYLTHPNRVPAVARGGPLDEHS